MSIALYTEMNDEKLRTRYEYHILTHGEGTMLCKHIALENSIAVVSKLNERKKEVGAKML